MEKQKYYSKLNKIDLVEKYLLDYINELIFHFDLSNSEIEVAILDAYSKIQTPNSFKKIVNLIKIFRL